MNNSNPSAGFFDKYFSERQLAPTIGAFMNFMKLERAGHPRQ